MTMKPSTLAAALLLTLTAGAQAASTNLIADGDFEAFTSLVTSGTQTRLEAGSTLGAWTVSSGNVDLLTGAGTGAINGMTLSLNGNTAGSITQSFQATQGQTYQLDFDSFKEGSSAPLYVNIGGQATYFGYTPTLTHRTVSWTAPSTGAFDLVFFDQANFNTSYGTTIDNVTLTAVAAVPEPQTYALALAGLGFVGFVARRRRAR